MTSGQSASALGKVATLENWQKSDTLNSPTPSPYSLSETEHGYCFVTEHGTKYELLFYRIHESYPIYSFSIDRQSNVYFADARVRATIIHVLRLFFENDMNAMVFTCDITDGRQFARFKLFDMWYRPHIGEYYREVYCKDIYLSSVIARRDNPLAKEMAEWFVSLMSEMIENI